MFSRNSYCWFLVGFITATITATQPVTARPIANTHYAYYSVSGMSAQSLHQSLVVHGPLVNGYRAYAATEMTSQQDGSLLQSGAGCQVRNYKMRLTFTVRLPRLKSGTPMTPDLRARWASFDRFVRAHEAVHRSIWMSCASEAEARVRAIRTGSCEAAQALATGIINETWTQCAKRHDAFDAAQRSPLMRQPFIIAANAAPQRFANDGSRVRAARAVRYAPRPGM
jgi:predicted secreted Zn-dependent protease